jgi:ABC-2 type transport system ATP-binding protein
LEVKEVLKVDSQSSVVSESSSHLDSKSQTIVVELMHVAKNYGSFTAVKDSSFKIMQGEIVALLGSNGAGKSSTIKMICGLLKPTSGKLELFGKSYDVCADLIRSRIGYMPEESAMYLDVTVEDYLLFFGRLYGNTDEKTKRIMEQFFLRLDLDARQKRLSELSKGMRRKVLLIRSLLNDPQLLIYDEPASGLDPQTSHVILDFLIELKKTGKTILFSSHNLEHVRIIADRLLIMRKSELIADTTVSAFTKNHIKEFIVKTDQGEHKVKATELAQFVQSRKVLDITSQDKSFEELYLEFIAQNTN